MLLRWFEHNQIFHPNRKMEATGAELKRPFEDVVFKTRDGVELNGWFFPAKNPGGADPGQAVRQRLVFLVCHGNGGNISHRLDLYRALLETAAAVFAFDYRGYGRSAGKPSEEGTYLDAQAAHSWLRQKNFAGKNILVYGESLGGAIAAELCLREETAGLVLQSTFTSIVELGAELYPWLPVRKIATIQYDTIGKLARVKVPVLVMHSQGDGLIGFRHAEKLFTAAGKPKLFWELEGAHNAPLSDRAKFIEGIENFLGWI